MKILGIHDGHSASAALVEDGKILAAVQEERLTRDKNQGGFPAAAIEEILQITGITLEQIDTIAFSGYGKSKVKTRDDIMANYYRKVEPKKRGPLSQFSRIFHNFPSEDAKRHRRLKRKQIKRSEPLIAQGVSSEKICFIEHHKCHAATAYYGQGVMDREILVLTCDAAGDNVSATVNIGMNGELKRLTEISRSDSVPILYSLITFLTGFVPLEHEYKLMGLAPYAAGSKYSESIRDHLKSFYRFTPEKPLGWERTPGTPDTFKLGPQLKKFIEYKRVDNIAGGLQMFIEAFFVEWVKRVIQQTGIPRVALSGGLFMNVKLNKLIMELPEVESVYIFPSCGDETNSIGAAWTFYAESLIQQGKRVDIPALGPLYLGSDFSAQDVEDALGSFNFKKKIKTQYCDDIEKKCAELIADGQVVARCKGPMEFGARALGNRSILSGAGDWDAVKTINEMIKMRDFWMPFAPSMLAEDAEKYLENSKKIAAPYMIIAFDTRKDKFEKIIAATHPYDETCRPQVVDADWNPDYHRLIQHYKELTQEGTVLNTSLNLHGYPIVYKPVDALEVFDNSGLRYLALGNTLVEETD